MRAQAVSMDGLLVVDKPRGLVSKDVSRWLVKRLGKLHLGHVGTLDPGAQGVLPILLGRATRLQDYLLEMPKTYEFDMLLGQETDTLDMDGIVVRQSAHEHVTAEMLESALEDFRGEIEQTPPLYSAVKFKGKPLYDYARQERTDEVPVEKLRRKVRIHRYEMLTYENGKGTFVVTCSKGTYVRTLVKDLAEKVGSCGTLSRLVRTHAAGVSLAESYTLEFLEQLLLENAGSLRGVVIPIGAIDLGLPRWRVDAGSGMGRLRAGQVISLSLAEYLASLETTSVLPKNAVLQDAASPHGVLQSLNTWGQPLTLCDESGMAFGIGSVRSQELGRVLVNMKRGL